MMSADDSAGTDKLAGKALGPAADNFGREVAPLGKEAGELTLRVGQLLLSPIRGVVYGIEFCGEWLREAVADRLRNVPPENITEPDPRIAVPATQALTNSMKDGFIREMYASLLATGMNSETSSLAHPAYVEMIKEMTPTDAQVLKELSGVAHCKFVLCVGDRATYIEITEKYSFEILTIGAREISKSLSNLERLGIVNIHAGHYHVVDRHDELQKELLAEHQRSFSKEELKEFTLCTNPEAYIDRHGIRMTPLGEDFITACLN